MREPQRRPLNKLGLKHKLIVNPKLKYLVNNVEETPMPKEKAKSNKKVRKDVRGNLNLLLEAMETMP